MIIYIDMDDVICEFSKQFEKAVLYRKTHLGGGTPRYGLC